MTIYGGKLEDHLWSWASSTLVSVGFVLYVSVCDKQKSHCRSSLDNRRYHDHLSKQMYANIKILRPHRHCIYHVGDTNELPGRNKLWSESFIWTPRQQQKSCRHQIPKYLHPPLRESYTAMAWKAEAQGRSPYSKTGIKKPNCHKDEDLAIWRSVLWSDEANIELFGHIDQPYVIEKKGWGFYSKEHYPICEA